MSSSRMSFQAYILQNVIRLRTKSQENPILSIVDPDTLFCTMLYISANNIVVKQSSRSRSSYAYARRLSYESVAQWGCTNVSIRLCKTPRRCVCTPWINGISWALWNKFDFFSSRVRGRESLCPLAPLAAAIIYLVDSQLFGHREENLSRYTLIFSWVTLHRIESRDYTHV